MRGGRGNDTYVVDQINDRVIEYADEGEDTVRSSISYNLGSSLENLSLTGGRHISGTGNSADNKVYGNSGNNRLRGLDGDDRISGGAGNDTLDGDAGADD